MARSFAGGTDRIFANAITGRPLSYSFWLNTATPGSTQVALVNGDNNLEGSAIVFVSSLVPLLTLNGTGVNITSSVAVPANSWTNIVASLNHNVRNEIFVNGVSGGFTTGGYVAATLGASKIGWGSAADGTSPMTCKLGETAFWNVNLTAGEITALANGARAYTIRPAALVGYFPIDGLQSPEPDLSDNANNGVVTGTTLAPSGPPIMQFTPRWPQFFELPPPPPPFYTIRKQVRLNILQTGP